MSTKKIVPIALIIIALTFLFTLIYFNNLRLNKSEFSGEEHIINSRLTEIEVKPNIKNIVIAENNIPLKIFFAHKKDITSYGNIGITANSLEAFNIADEIKLIYEDENEDTIYINFPSSFNYKEPINIKEINITIPSNLPVKLVKQNADIDIFANFLQSNLDITSNNNISITILASANLNIVALVKDTNSLGGNIDWQIEKTKLAKIKGIYNIGELLHDINIVSEGIVTVNKYT